MQKQHVIKFVGSQQKLAELLRISPASVSQWRGKVPLKRADEIKYKIKQTLNNMFVGNESFLKQTGMELALNGYDIVPITQGCKYPKGLDWQNSRGDLKNLQGWLSNGFTDGGVGIRASRVPAIDIDVQDERIAVGLQEWCFNKLGYTLVRIGNKPKRLLMYRAKRPFRKIVSKKYRCSLGKIHRVEVLGEGQQFVAFAVHPETGKPYVWDADLSPVDVALDELPAIEKEKAESVIEKFESMVPDEWECVSPGAAHGVESNLEIPQEERLMWYGKPKLDVTSEKLENALKKIDADDYELWVRVGMGLHHQFGGGIEGRDLWDRWSQKSEKYSAEIIDNKWKSFGRNNYQREPVTAATILRLEKQQERKNVCPENLIDQFLRRYIYIRDGDRVCDLDKAPRVSVCKLKEWRNEIANMRYEIPEPTKYNPKKKKDVPVSGVWLKHPERKDVIGTTYDPRGGRVVKDENGNNWVNEFCMPEFPETNDQTELKVFFDHMEYLFPVFEDRQWFLDWMAFNVQKPWQRCKVTPLHVSTLHGTGRGWIVECLRKLLGPWNLKKTTMRTLSGEHGQMFNEFLYQSLVCAIEEVKEDGHRFSVSDKIRDVLTEDSLEINMKYGQKDTLNVYTNFFLMSNHIDALVLGKEDRRIYVMEGPDYLKELVYYEQLYKWLETKGVNQLYNYLNNRNIKDFNWQVAPLNLAKLRMIYCSHSETESLFLDLLDDLPVPAMTLNQILKELRKRSDEDNFSNIINEYQVIKLLKQGGFPRTRVKVEGKVLRVWTLTGKIPLDNNELRDSVLKYGF